MAIHIHAADLHLGDTTNDPEGLFRESEAMGTAQAIVGIVRDTGASRLFLAGDTYMNRRPHPWAYIAMTALVSGCEAAGCIVDIVPGNHDAADPGKLGPLDVVPLGFVHREPSVITADGVSYAVLPWFSAAYAAAQYPDLKASERDLLLRTAAERVLLSLPADYLVSHFTAQGATFCSETQPQIGQSSEFILPASAVRGYRRGFFGHIHKPQDIQAGPCTITYPGSTHLRDFGETHKPRVIAFDTERETSTDHLLPYTRFLTLDINAAAFSMHDVDGCVCRIAGDLPRGLESAALIAEAERDLRLRGAIRIGKDAVKYEQHEQRVNSGITVDTDTRTALGAYCEAVGGDFEANRAELLAKHDTLEVGR